MYTRWFIDSEYCSPHLCYHGNNYCRIGLFVHRKLLAKYIKVNFPNIVTENTIISLKCNKSNISTHVAIRKYHILPIKLLIEL